MQGNEIIAKSLATHGLQHCFGIVGVPVIELGMALQQEGMNFYGCRNEQGASYSAGAVGYLTGKPGICLGVSGPGMVHAVAGLANAWSNKWPMVLIAGSSPVSQDAKGSFQETDQVFLAKPFCKFAIKVLDATNIPLIIEKAIRISMSGSPGPVYLDFPGDILSGEVEEETIHFCKPMGPLPFPVSPYTQIQQAVAALKQAKSPLMIIGKGAQISRAENECKEFVELTNVPFLPTPMGKGLVSDTHKNCIGAARSTALGGADVILLCGARLNWILHYGLPPRFKEDVKIIQIDICPEEFDTNIQGYINLNGHIRGVVSQLTEESKKTNFKFSEGSEWWNTLKQKVVKNVGVSAKLMASKELPMNYYSAFAMIKKHMPKNFIYVGEGANTMDIGRTIIDQYEPRTKLDAGTYGTMGVGCPQALAAKAVHPDRPVVAILGDSAFGFSAMEIETAVRYNLPFVVFIINNNGIGVGNKDTKDLGPQEMPVTFLKIDTRYEKMADAFGGEGIFVTNFEELESACKKAFSQVMSKVTIVNVMIDPRGDRKPQEHHWLTQKEAKQAKL